MGGPAEYSNEVLQNVHTKHNIDKATFDEVAMLFRKTLEEFEIEPADVREAMDEITSRASYIISV